MIKIFLVGIGGSTGAVSRYLIARSLYRILGQSGFPYGTLAVNVLGCVLIGFLNGVAEHRQIFTPETRLLIFMGFLGSFTTFSTFGYETVTLARDGHILMSFTNLMLHLFCGLGAVWLGSLCSHAV